MERNLNYKSLKTISLVESNEDVTLKKFSGGECHVQLNIQLEHAESVRIHTRLNSSDDIMILLLAVDALRRLGIHYIEVFIPYFPFARQDRVMTKGEPLSVRVMADLINGLNLNKVIIVDPHSDVTRAVLNNLQVLDHEKFVRHFLETNSITDFHLVSPDLGAYKKVEKLARTLSNENELITGIKIRNLKTGEIIQSEINTQLSIIHKPCVIVDDICDGGRTFIELASALKNKGAKDLYLIVSHGIFSYNALERLKAAGFRKVFSSNSIQDREESEFYQSINLFTNELFSESFSV